MFIYVHTRVSRKRANAFKHVTGSTAAMLHGILPVTDILVAVHVRERSFAVRLVILPGAFVPVRACVCVCVNAWCDLYAFCTRGAWRAQCAIGLSRLFANRALQASTHRSPLM